MEVNIQMKRTKRPQAAWLGPLLCLALIPSAAQAYLDPSTGSLMLQAAVGGFLATLAAVKMYWRKIKGLWGPRRQEPETGSQNL